MTKQEADFIGSMNMCDEISNEAYNKIMCNCEVEESQPCEDCISREEAIDKTINYFHDEYYQRTSIQECRSCFVNDVLLKLPAIQSARPKGEWIASTEYGSILHKCSKCHKYNDWESDFCPNCGCRMNGGGEE